MKINNLTKQINNLSKKINNLKKKKPSEQENKQSDQANKQSEEKKPSEQEKNQSEQENKSKQITPEDTNTKANIEPTNAILEHIQNMTPSQKTLIETQLNELNEIALQCGNDSTMDPSLKLSVTELDSANLSYSAPTDRDAKAMDGMTPRSIASWALSKKQLKDDSSKIENDDDLIDKLIDDLNSPSTPPRPQNLRLKPKEFYASRKVIEPQNGDLSSIYQRTRAVTVHPVIAPESTFPGIPMHIVNDEINHGPRDSKFARFASLFTPRKKEDQPKTPSKTNTFFSALFVKKPKT